MQAETHRRGGPAAGTESALVAGFLANRPEAIGTVAAWARQVARHRDWGFETPEDIVQATLLVLVTNFRENRFTGGNLRAYVQRIAKNMCVSSYRRARVRRGTVSLDQEPAIARNAAAEVEDPDQELTVQSILRRLDEPCRRLIQLAFGLGLSRREIAARLGVAEVTARVRLYRCLRAAKDLAES